MIGTESVLVPMQKSRPRRGPCWWPVFLSAGRNAILFQCPNGHTSSLLGHSIASVKGDAMVFQSVGCPRCDYHANIVLSGFDPELTRGFFRLDGGEVRGG